MKVIDLVLKALPHASWSDEGDRIRFSLGDQRVEVASASAICEPAWAAEFAVRTLVERARAHAEFSVVNKHGVPTGAKAWPVHLINGDVIEFGGTLLSCVASGEVGFEEVRDVAMGRAISKYLTPMRREKVSHEAAEKVARELEYRFVRPPVTAAPPSNRRFLLLLLCR